MKVKSKTPDDKKKGVIYQVPCKECTVFSYTQENTEGQADGTQANSPER